MFAQFADLIAPSKKADQKKKDEPPSAPLPNPSVAKEAPSNNDTSLANEQPTVPPPSIATPTTPSVATVSSGWSNRQQFRPVHRQRPQNQVRAKPAFVIPAGATVVSTTTIDKPPASVHSQPTPASGTSSVKPSPAHLPAKDSLLPSTKSYMKQDPPKSRKKNKAKQEGPPPIDLYEDYDPLKPTDYEQYKEEMAILRHSKRRNSDSSSSSRSPSPDRQRNHSFAPSYEHSDSATSPHRTIPAPAPSAFTQVNLQETGDEAYQRRLLLSQQRQAQDAQQAMIPASQESAAWKMMNKYGWQAGQGLGKTEEGIQSALAVEARGDGSGVIMPQKRASTVMLLTNMVVPDDVDDALQQETAEECARFGEVERCIVYQVPAHIPVPEDQSVRIFVKFANGSSLQQALRGLHGRYFGGRIVSAVAYDPDRFDALDLDPSN
ncbi:hypothetical protein DM01DRAFT_1405870, partial [Hesseltinella vesiculosa]